MKCLVLHVPSIKHGLLELSGTPSMGRICFANKISRRVRFGRLVSLGTEVGRSGTTLGEVAGEHWLDERPEDNLGTTLTQLEIQLSSSRDRPYT